ncbi:hypothetical protein D3C87_1071800 [compost metagenome]
MEQSFLKKHQRLAIFILLAVIAPIVFSACKKNRLEEESIKLSPNSKMSANLAAAVNPINPLANANAAYDGFLSAFLVKSGNATYIVDGLSKRDRAYFWDRHL